MMGGVASWTYGDDDSESEDAESGSEGGSEDASEDEASPAQKTSTFKGRAALKPGVVQGTGRRAAKSDRTMDIDDEEEDD